MRRTLRGVLLGLTALALMWWLAAAHAQRSPTVSLGSSTYIVGETLEITAVNLEPGGTYHFELTPPAEDDVDPETVITTLVAPGNGALTFEAFLKQGGTYVVKLEGPHLNATLNVNVSGTESAIGLAPPPGAEDAPEETEPDSTAEEAPAPEEDEDELTVEEGNAEASEAQEEQEETPEAAAEVADEPADEAAEEITSEGAQPAGSPAEDGIVAEDGAQDEDSVAVTPADEDDGETPGAKTPLGIEFNLIDGAVVASAVIDGSLLWRLDFPDGSGETAGLASSDSRVVVGRGNHLLELDPLTGAVKERLRLPAQIEATALEDGHLEVALRYQGGAQETLTLPAAGRVPLLPFDPDPVLYQWLRNEAALPNPGERLESDPTNPWLYMAELERTPGGLIGEGLVQGALQASETFYERAQLADALLRLDPPRLDLAEAAMEAAARDFFARGYHTELLTDDGLDAAYAFPMSGMRSALNRKEMARASFYADWVYRLYPRGSSARAEVLTAYARALRELGEKDEATLWRSRANEAGGFKMNETLTSAAETVGRTGWYGVTALLASIVALTLTLLAKYWRPQSLALRRRREAGKPVSAFWARSTFMRYATFAERLVLVLLFAATLALAALQGWATSLAEAPAVLGSGSLGTPVALEAVAQFTGEGDDALFVTGFAAQAAGDSAAAERAYAQLTDDPAALNNLGVLRSDPALFQRALSLNPDLAAAQANSGTGPAQATPAWEFAPVGPRLVVPGSAQVRTALAGTYLSAWAAVFSNPWEALTTLPGITVPAWVWAVIVVVFLLFALAAVLTLFMPRPRLARNSPRTFVYHLLSILLPGTGLADEFWGVLLMVPWAIFGVDYLLHQFRGLPEPVMSLTVIIPVLTIIYLVNLVAFFVELASYRRRMNALKQADPVTAREYGMRLPKAELG